MANATTWRCTVELVYANITVERKALWMLCTIQCSVHSQLQQLLLMRPATSSHPTAMPYPLTSAWSSSHASNMYLAKQSAGTVGPWLVTVTFMFPA